MMDYGRFFECLEETTISEYARRLRERTDHVLERIAHGDYPKWRAVIDSLPAVRPAQLKLDAAAVTIGRQDEMDDRVRTEFQTKLMELHPWRKGPFNIFGVPVDTEWRSDLKWTRLADRIDSLDRRVILDVGSGNGYYMCRMLGRGADAVVGVDPYLLYVMQFEALNRYIATERAAVLPLRLEDLPDEGNFDTVFSMGILYHRRDPQEHLRQLCRLLRPGGQLVLETLVLTEAGAELLVPDGRYARMRNVWAIASPTLIEAWLDDCGFADIACIDITPTTPREQRKTAWMQYDSLADFLDPGNPLQTVEGYPAPVRGIFLARKG